MGDLMFGHPDKYKDTWNTALALWYFLDPQNHRAESKGVSVEQYLNQDLLDGYGCLYAEMEKESHHKM